MKNLWSLLLIVAFTVGCVNVETDENLAIDGTVVKAENTGVFIHISSGSDNAHKALMGLKMATVMAEDKDVAVYLDIKGIELVTKGNESVTFNTFPPSDEMLKQLLESGVPVMACPGCMMALGVTEDMLMDGVIVADKETFFNFTEGRILTLDY